MCSSISRLRQSTFDAAVRRIGIVMQRRYLQANSAYPLSGFSTSSFTCFVRSRRAKGPSAADLETLFR
jgi:hypothetical protein